MDNAAGPFYKDVAIIRFNPHEPTLEHTNSDLDLVRQQSTELAR